MYDVKSMCADDFINDDEIRDTLAYADAHKADVELIDQIIEKAKKKQKKWISFFVVCLVLLMDLRDLKI